MVPVRRPLPAIAAVAAFVIAVVAVVVVLTRGGDDKPAPLPDARPEALAFAPRDAPGVIAVDTAAPAAGAILQQLVPRLTDNALTGADVRPLLGRDAAVALLDPRARRGTVAFVARDRARLEQATDGLRATGAYRGARLYAARSGAVATRGLALVAAPDAAALRRALDARADPSGHITPAVFDARLTDLPKTAPVQAIFDARRVLLAQQPEVGRTRWGRALRGGAAVLQAGGDGIRIPFRIASAPGLTPADLPFAPGARPPVARGRAPLVAGIRGFDRLIAFLRVADPDRFRALNQIDDAVPAFLGLDIDGLLDNVGTEATVTTADLRTLVVRTDPRNAGAWRTAVNSAATLSSILQRVGVDGIEIDEQPGEVYRLRVDGRLVARVAVYGRTLVATNDPRADLRAAARAPRSPVPPGAAGGLTVRVQAPLVRTRLSAMLGLPAEAAPLLERLRDLTGWARAETSGVRGELRLGVR